MIRLAALLWMTSAAAAGSSLEPAQAAFARGEYDRAQALALEASRTSPRDTGAALYLAGLARFRAGRFAEALEAIDAAGRAADAPPRAQWLYNRGACLNELGRFEEAESAYVDAAALDETLASLSLVNAGFAALDAGAPDRARAFAQRARATAATPAARELVDDLERQIASTTSPSSAAATAAAAAAPETTATAGTSTASTAAQAALDEYRAGLAAYDLGRYDEARRRFERACQLNPDDGRSRIMAGATLLKLGERAQGRAELERALTQRLDGEDATIARDYLDSLSRGLAYYGEGWGITARLGTAYDSNVLQSGSFGQEDFVPFADNTTSSAAATADVAVSWRKRLGDAWFAELGYGLDQLAYLTTTASDYSLQQHLLTGAVEYAATRTLRLGLSAAGEFDLTGLSAVRSLQRAAGGGIWAALDENETTTTRLDLELTGKQGGPGFDYLSGARTDVALTQAFWLPLFSFDLGYRFRDERIGTLTDTGLVLPVGGLCQTVPATSCSQSHVIPFGYASHQLSASARAPFAERFSLAVAAGFEMRSYLGDSYMVLTQLNGAQQQLDRRRREDERFFAGASAGAHVWRGLDLVLRYDFVANASNMAQSPECEHRSCGHQFDYNNKNYLKHLVSLETVYRW